VKRFAVISLCVLVFIAISILLARLGSCRRSPTCLATVRTDAGSLRRPGAVKILSVKSRTSYSLGAASGTTRIAWIVIGRLPVVQCVQVHRSGNVLAGIDVKLLAISAPIPNEADC